MTGFGSHRQELTDEETEAQKEGVSCPSLLFQWLLRQDQVSTLSLVYVPLF